MSAIIISGGRSEDYFGQDVGIDKQTSERVIVAIRRVVKDSFGERLREARESDVQERSKICQRWFKELHGQLGWTVSRALGQDGIALALACELAGLHFAPAEVLDGLGYRTYKQGRVPWDRIG